MNMVCKICGANVLEEYCVYEFCNEKNNHCPDCHGRGYSGIYRCIKCKHLNSAKQWCKKCNEWRDLCISITSIKSITTDNVMYIYYIDHVADVDVKCERCFSDIAISKELENELLNILIQLP